MPSFVHWPVSDHFHPWSEAGQSSFIWTWLGAVAVQTNRIHMGPGVTCPTLRYHPSILAQASATVSCYAPHRTYLGVGTGEALNEYAATGMWPSYKERQERLGEAIELIRALWRGEEVTFEGKYYQTRKAKLFTPPASKIPLYISQYIDLGFNYLIFHSAGPNHRAFIEGYGRDILPRLRSRVGTASRVRAFPNPEDGGQVS